jgi:hypothetical protein
MSKKEILERVKELIRMQDALSRRFIENHLGSRGLENLLFAPNHGEINADGFQWKFTKHGGGVLFSRIGDGLTVDMHKHLDNPKIFDAWRLRQFLESFGIYFSEEECLGILKEMVALGTLVESDQYHHFAVREPLSTV